MFGRIFICPFISYVRTYVRTYMSCIQHPISTRLNIIRGVSSQMRCCVRCIRGVRVQYYYNRKKKQNKTKNAARIFTAQINYNIFVLFLISWIWVIHQSLVLRVSLWVHLTLWALVHANNSFFDRLYASDFHAIFWQKKNNLQNLLMAHESFVLLRNGQFSILFLKYAALFSLHFVDY